jgi:hypothetical protein
MNLQCFSQADSVYAAPRQAVASDPESARFSGLKSSEIECAPDPSRMDVVAEGLDLDGIPEKLGS